MVSSPSIFAKRVPEAAAMQLSVVLAWLTECQLATFEGLANRKSTSQSELKRQREICAKAVFHCSELGVRPSGLGGEPCPRLQALLPVAEHGDFSRVMVAIDQLCQ